MELDEIKDEYMIDPSKLSLGSKFSQGASSEIYHGKYIDTDVAVKIVKDPGENKEASVKLKKQFNAEVTFLSRLDHPNIVKFIGACREPQPRIITKYVPQGSLSAYLDKNNVPQEKMIKMALEIAQGMEYIHAQGVIHKDLKSDNILIDNDFVLKIADFGISCEEEYCNEVSYGTGTYRWMAPELINNKFYGRKVDVFSYGVVLWELLTGMVPYKDLIIPLQVAVAVSQKKLRPDIPEDCPPRLRSLIERCWSSEPEKRPEFCQIVKELEQFNSSIGDCIVKDGFCSFTSLCNISFSVITKSVNLAVYWIAKQCSRLLLLKN